MRNKLSSVFYMWMAFGLGIVAVIGMFLPFISMAGGTIKQATYFFWTSGPVKGAWPSFVGFMLILTGSIASAVIALPICNPSAKVEKIVLISSAAAILVGVVLVVLTQYLFAGFNGNKVGMTASDMTYCAGLYISAVCALGAVAMDIIAVKLDW